MVLNDYMYIFRKAKIVIYKTCRMVSSPKGEYFGILQCCCCYDNLWSRETTLILHSDDALQVGALSLNMAIHSAAVKKISEGYGPDQNSQKES